MRRRRLLSFASAQFDDAKEVRQPDREERTHEDDPARGEEDRYDNLGSGCVSGAIARGHGEG